MCALVILIPAARARHKGREGRQAAERTNRQNVSSLDKWSMLSVIVHLHSLRRQKKAADLGSGPQAPARRATNFQAAAAQMAKLIPDRHTAPLALLSRAAPTQHRASNNISGSQTEGKNLPWMRRTRSVGRNRVVKVNVKPEKDEWPSLGGAGFTRQARAGQRFQPLAMNRGCEELLSACCPSSSCWHTGEPAKLCWTRQRVTALLYLEDRSSPISLPLTLLGRDGAACGGNLSSASLQVVHGAGQGAPPHQARKQDRFSAETSLMFTLRNPGGLTPQRCFRWSRWAHGGSPPCSKRNKNKIPASFLPPHWSLQTEKRTSARSEVTCRDDWIPFWAKPDLLNHETL